MQLLKVVAVVINTIIYLLFVTLETHAFGQFLYLEVFAYVVILATAEAP